VKNSDNDFLDFLTGRDELPPMLKEGVRKDILLSFRGRAIVLKFLFFQVLGALFSLSVCPQFGLGLVEGHGIAHHFRMMGDWACASFCGALFLSAGIATAFVSMKGEELWWVWRRYKYSIIFLPTLMWSTLMLLNVSFNLSSETVLFHVTWIMAAILTQYLLMQARSLIYRPVSP
jgi:hypothetical protein